MGLKRLLRRWLLRTPPRAWSSNSAATIRPREKTEDSAGLHNGKEEAGSSAGCEEGHLQRGAADEGQEALDRDRIPVLMDLWIKSSIFECVSATGGEFKRRHMDEVSGVVIHRIGPGGKYKDKYWPMTTGAEIAEFFRNFEPIGKMAYTFVIREDGKVEQCLPLSYISPAGKILNRGFVHIALVGDFRKKPIAPKQAAALEALTLSLCRTFGTRDVRGHMETKGASSDSKKECPGDRLNLAGLRETVVNNYMKAKSLSGVRI